MTICVYCSSSNALDPSYIQAAEELGMEIGKRGHTLIYGGTREGLMGVTALSTKKHGGKVIGVIPEILREKNIGYDESDEMVIVKTLRERKLEMENRADAFIALPGGFGTLDEVMEQMALKQLGYHEKPIVFLNTLGFYSTLMSHFERIFDEKFTHPYWRKLYTVEETPAQIFTVYGW